MAVPTYAHAGWQINATSALAFSPDAGQGFGLLAAAGGGRDLGMVQLYKVPPLPALPEPFMTFSQDALGLEQDNSEVTQQGAAMQFGVHHHDPVTVALSPCCKRLAVGTVDGTLRLHATRYKKGGIAHKRPLHDRYVTRPKMAHHECELMAPNGPCPVPRS